MGRSKRQLPNRTCVVCNKEYYACKSCYKLRDSGIVGWRMSCDTPECFKILNILTSFDSGQLNDVEAYDMLSETAINELESIAPEAKVIVDKIFVKAEVDEAKVSETKEAITTEIVKEHKTTDEEK